MILILGVLTMVIGALLALFSVDLKRTLACSSVSQIGFILVGVGMSTARLAEWTGHKDKSPAVFQVIPNTAASIGKSMTFMSAANADAEQVAAVKSCSIR